MSPVEAALALLLIVVMGIGLAASLTLVRLARLSEDDEVADGIPDHLTWW